MIQGMDDSNKKTKEEIWRRLRKAGGVPCTTKQRLSSGNQRVAGMWVPTSGRSVRLGLSVMIIHCMSSVISET